MKETLNFLKLNIKKNIPSYIQNHKMTYLHIKNFVKTAESRQSFENTLTLFLTDTSSYWQERQTLPHHEEVWAVVIDLTLTFQLAAELKYRLVKVTYYL